MKVGSWRKYSNNNININSLLHPCLQLTSNFLGCSIWHSGRDSSVSGLIRCKRDGTSGLISGCVRSPLTATDAGAPKFKAGLIISCKTSEFSQSLCKLIQVRISFLRSRGLLTQLFFFILFPDDFLTDLCLGGESTVSGEINTELESSIFSPVSLNLSWGPFTSVDEARMLSVNCLRISA